MKKHRWPVVLSALCLVGSGLLTNCQPATSSTNEADSTALNKPAVANLPTVVWQPARKATFALTAAATGLIRTPAQSRLSFRMGGTIRQVLVHNGSLLSAGQVMARLDDRDQQLALRQAQDQLAESRVQLRALIAEFGGNELDTASLKPNTRAFVLTKSGFYKAQTALAQARQQLDYTTLRAPYAGMVANLTAKPYNFITSYEPFCTLLSRAGLLVEFSILESELATVRVGLPVRVMPVAVPGRTYAGQVQEINPFVNAQGLVLVKARINQPDNQLFEGMNARIVIERRIPDQLVIPKSAVVERSGRKVVFTVEDNANNPGWARPGLAKWNYVTIAHENDTEVAISEGLKPGDRVIVSGNLNLAHDAPVGVEKQ
ncbi:efflux RND transporter periplasmic adaptor subunit [Spirosoma fluviale]|uniref:RND family efflux transporter, MFP subunit n=1 Tax=Spirosoma fluviale TaxID=1597977 RepID=A0A286FIJ9_9BACT|nr:efflux RND transporter periplasmic adaptor subunit [Spirosoma fluviale]SOD83043.1 RND family efflux transporter, MFP subunit [Spirosoma fluviale]